MTTIIQTNPFINVHTPLGNGRAIFIIDYSPEMNTCWVVVLNKTGEVKHFDSNDIRVEQNFTYGQSTVDIPQEWVK